MEDRVLMAKFNPKWVIDPMEAPMCACGQSLLKDEVVALYPIYGMDEGLRDIVCMTCHFWFVHDVMSESEAA